MRRRRCLADTTQLEVQIRTTYYPCGYDFFSSKRAIPAIYMCSGISEESRWRCNSYLTERSGTWETFSSLLMSDWLEKVLVVVVALVRRRSVQTE